MPDSLMEQLSNRIRNLETAENPIVYNVATSNVSNPPTQGETDTAFGATAAQVRDGWSGVIYDNVDSYAWLATSIADSWWFVNIGTSGVGPHTILNAPVHTDTVTQAVSAGALIYGNATPKWDKTTHLTWSESTDILTITPQAAGGITFAGATTFNRIRTPDNVANALYVDDAGGLSYWRINSTNANPYIELFPAGGGSVKTEYNSITNTILGVNCGDSMAGAGADNTLLGYNCGTAINTGIRNVLIGSQAGAALTNGAGNIVIGYSTLAASTASNLVIAIGNNMLNAYSSAASPGSPIAIGQQCLNALTTGLYNTVVGQLAALTMTTGQMNTIMGFQSLRLAQTNSSNNTAIGYSSLYSTTTGNNNTALGRGAGGDGSAPGSGDLTTGLYNTFLGIDTKFSSGTQRNYTTAIGYTATSNQSNSCILGGLSTGSAWVDVGIGTDTPAAHVHQVKYTNLTNSAQDMIRLGHNTSGTAAAGFGSDIEWYLQSSTTATQNASQLRVSWENATHANRSARAIHSVVSNTALVEFMRLVGSSTQAETVFNEQQADIDFRIESDNEAYAYFMQASNGYSGFGASVPTTRIQSQEDYTLSGNIGDGTAATLTFKPAYNGAFTVTRHNYMQIIDVTVGGSTVTNSAVMWFDNVFGTHKALAASFNTTDSNGDTTTWAGGVIINVNGTLYKLPAIAL